MPSFSYFDLFQEYLNRTPPLFTTAPTGATSVATPDAQSHSDVLKLVKCIGTAEWASAGSPRDLHRRPSREAANSTIHVTAGGGLASATASPPPHADESTRPSTITRANLCKLIREKYRVHNIFFKSAVIYMYIK